MLYRTFVLLYMYPPLKCFKNVLCLTLKHLQKCCKTFQQDRTRVENRPWLHVKQNICKKMFQSRQTLCIFANVLEMFYFTCNHGLTSLPRRYRRIGGVGKLFRPDPFCHCTQAYTLIKQVLLSSMLLVRNWTG